MSLIQEALRRKEEEQGRNPPAAGGQVLPPPAAPIQAPPGKGVGAVRMFCYVVLFAGAAAGLFSLYRSFTLESAPITVNAPVTEEVPVATVAAPPVEERLVEPIVELPVPRPRKAQPPPVRVATPVVKGDWPELRVTGVFARPEQKDSSAFIDGLMEEVGAMVAGVELMEVRENGVLLRYGSEERFVRVGRTTLR